MKRIPKESEIRSVEKYAEYLREQLQELCISQSELAKAVGISQKTISRYVNGENSSLPDHTAKNKIKDFFEKKSKFGDYHHMPSKDFGELLNKLLYEYEMTQEELAEKIGRKQKNISQYISGAQKLNTQEQYNILKIFYEIAYLDYGICDYPSADYLDYLLNGAENYYDIMSEESEYFAENERYYSDRYCMEYILTLSDELQDIILEHYQAFFEQTNKNLEEAVSVMVSSYGEREMLLDKFREMPDAEKDFFVAELEQNTFLTYPYDKDTNEILYFETVSAMRDLLSDENYFNDDEIGQKQKKADDEEKVGKNMRRIEELRYTIGWSPDSVDELIYKLSFTRYEWYVWMLLLINAHNNTL